MKLHIAVEEKSDQKLLADLDHLAKTERETLAEVLRHLKEIERRKLYLEIGYKSLFQYCVKKLSYSEPQAYRRINAAKILPEIEDSVRSGRLHLSNISKAQSFFRRNGSSSKERRMVFRKLEKKSAREGDRILGSLEKKATASKVARQDPFQEKLKILRGLIDSELSYAPDRVVLEFALDHAIEQLLKQKKHRKIWLRDKARCVKCNSVEELSVLPIRPKLLGGTKSMENMRLLCSRCAGEASVPVYAKKQKKMLLNKKLN